MPDPETGIPTPSRAPETRFDARCQMCSRISGQVLDGVFVHHPDCAGTPVLKGRLPRCCNCGARLYLEPAQNPMLSAADLEAARHHRPSRS